MPRHAPARLSWCESAAKPPMRTRAAMFLMLAIASPAAMAGEAVSVTQTEGAAVVGAAANDVPGCAPLALDPDALLALKAGGWQLASDRRAELALALAGCLRDPDPQLRDAIAFDALSHWMRAGELDPVTLRALRGRLLPMLDERGEPGFAAPFAALVLAEVARVDRIAPYLDARERAALVEAAAGYLESVRDYRGFDAAQGWRHGVAHGADFALQLILNPAVDATHVQRLLAAVAAQVDADGRHAYVHGESARLAMPVLYAARRGLLDAAQWDAWVAAVAAPAPLADWSQAFSSEAGLARLHNTNAFLLVLYASLQESDDERSRATLLPAVRRALHALP